MAEESCRPRPATPPTAPTHNIRLSQEALEQIGFKVFPQASSCSNTEAPPGTFWNNRIYFLTVEDFSYPGAGGEFVIKVMGQFWGSEKVQNEVACLWLLERHCPTIPSPRVVAWSEDGCSVTVVCPDRFKSRTTTLDLPRPLGWILVEKLPGQDLSTFDLSREEEALVGRELARITATWRTSIPPAEFCGNIQIRPVAVGGGALTNLNEGVLSDCPDVAGSNLTVFGLLPDGRHVKTYSATSLDYYRARLGEQVVNLETNPVYVPNLDLAGRVRDLVSTHLPQLSVAQQRGGFVFTHFDSAPRNLLAERITTRDCDGEDDADVGGLKISGIIDFEFSGFFPPLEEFVNDHIDNSGDWSDVTYSAYLDGLAERGIAAPERGCDGKTWRQACLLGVLENNIAPWRLSNLTPLEEGRRILDEARVEIEKALDELLEMAMA